MVKDLIDLSFDLFEHRAGNPHTSRIRVLFQSRRDVHSVTKNIISLNDHVAYIHTNAPKQSFRFRQFAVLVCELSLNENRCTHGINRTGKLDQQPVPCCFEYPAVVFSELGVENAFACQF